MNMKRKYDELFDGKSIFEKKQQTFISDGTRLAVIRINVPTNGYSIIFYDDFETIQYDIYNHPNYQSQPIFGGAQMNIQKPEDYKVKLSFKAPFFANISGTDFDKGFGGLSSEEILDKIDKMSSK